MTRLPTPTPDHELPLLYIAALKTPESKRTYPANGFDVEALGSRRKIELQPFGILRRRAWVRRFRIAAIYGTALPPLELPESPLTPEQI